MAAALATIRLATVFLTPVELYPDEAQYWAWSRTLDWGYFSKPPMVAWLTWATTAIGGDEEGWVRLSSGLLQTGAGLAVFAAGRRLYDARTGFWASALYGLTPGVMLSSVVLSTDAAMLFFLAVALWTYAGLLTAERRAGWAAGLGLALGLAFLSKYAAIYFVIGLSLHALLSADARGAWRGRRWALAAAGALLCLAPNLAWNAAHGFATVSHTAANASWSLRDLIHPLHMLEFVGAQAGVFGPLPLLMLILAGLAVARRRAPARDLLLLCFLLPPLAIVTAQAFLARANANWAAAYLPAAALLVAAWAVRRPAPRLFGLALLTQAVALALGTAAMISPSVADAIGLGNGLKRARGWAATAAVLEARARAQQAGGGLTAVAVDHRFLFNAMAYYARDYLAEPGAPPLTIWVRKAEPDNQAETTAPLTAANGERTLVISMIPEYPPLIARDFRRAGPPRRTAVPLDERRTRELTLFVAEGFARAPRDSVSGLPTAP